MHQFDSFNEYANHKNNESAISNDIVKTESSPQELLESSIAEINSTLCDDLMSELLKMQPFDFEHLIVKLLIKMGYGTLKQNAEAVTKKSGDEGIDGIVSADKFGFDSIYIQAKNGIMIQLSADRKFKNSWVLWQVKVLLKAFLLLQLVFQKKPRIMLINNYIKK